MTFRIPEVGHQLPRRGNRFSAFVGRAALRLAGWRFAGDVPDLPKVVFIVAPHTSNWDFIVGVAGMFALGLRITFLGKASLFRWPLGPVMRWLGGFPVDRSAAHNVVDQTVDLVRRSRHIALGLAPEGTRRKRARWRTGFHYVAAGAGVPIVPVALDYGTRTIRFFGAHTPGPTPEADLAVLGRLFDARMARHPSQY
ncbi:MAG TPA: lysophospholipid acyltransferase family protein [Gemmatimonadaceae bacterium]|nr:lysophospholipid acyltransferase family protein [Gemmatimonadaceae bacterium]